MSGGFVQQLRPCGDVHGVDKSPLAAGQALRDFLEQPLIAVRIAERGERRVRAALRVQTRDSARAIRAEAPAVEDLADVHAASHEIGACDFDVLHGKEQSVSRARAGVANAGSEDDRSLRARRSLLHQAWWRSWGWDASEQRRTRARRDRVSTRRTWRWR